MMKTLIFLVIFVSANIEIVKGGSGFVTLWTPQFVQEDAHYRLFVLPTDLHKKVDVAVQFRKSSATLALTDGKVSTIEFQSAKARYFGKKKEFDLIMTLSRNVSNLSGGRMQCSTKSISVKTSTGNFYNFIQTDKPIYKPGDTVQFRILTVDKNLKPFHRNSINVTITDPFNRSVAYFDDQQNKFLGVFESNFTLSTITIHGDWKLTVIVDNKPHMAASKIFNVKEYSLPLFDAIIDIPDAHVLQQDDITFSVYGKYSFGEFVSGNAELIIRDPENGREYLNTVIDGIKSPHVVKYNLQSLGVRTSEEVKLEIFLKFTEPESKINFNKTANFYAHYDLQRKLVVEHTQKFLPGFPFAMKVFVNDWKGNRIMSHFERILVTYYYTLKNGQKGDIESTGELRDGVYNSEIKISDEYKEFKVRVEFAGSKPYTRTIEMGSINVGINSLLVKHSPEDPKLNDKIKIFVTSDRELKNVLIAVVTRFGISDNQQVSCNGKKLCEFEVKVTDKMMPSSTIMVYDVRGYNSIFQGSTKIITKDIGRNELQLEIPSDPVKTRQDVKMKFTTKSQSTIYLLAFDKRLKSLRDGNDITKTDVTDAIDFDGENELLGNDMTSWSDCTPEEIERITKGRSYIVKHSGNKFTTKEPEDIPNDAFNWGDETPPAKKEDPDADEYLREYFPETWIFESLQVKSGKSLEKIFKTPDSITTWLVSAFSVHKDAGFALAPTQELVVKNEFFAKMDLPYSIRYKEVLKLKILIFNYVKTNEEIDVKLQLMNQDGKQFEFVDYYNCKPKYNTETQILASTDLKVPHGEVKTVTFYIRSHQTSAKDSKVSNKMIIRSRATATDKSGNKYIDNLQKVLKVEPIGVKDYRVTSKFHNLNGDSKLDDGYIKVTNYSGALSSIDVIVAGDFLTKSTKLDTFETFATYCLEQRTSKLKRYVDTFRYLKALKKEESKNQATELYQLILKTLDEKYPYMDFPWYRSYLANVLGLAMESGALPKDSKLLIESLNMVEKVQESNGTFSNFKFYYGLPGTPKTSEYDATKHYFAAGYCLIPFLRHKQLLGTRYDKFIKQGIRFLKDSKNQLEVTSFGLSVGAYALALNGDKDDAQKILNKEEMMKIQFHQQNSKCYKIYATDRDCNIRVTTYVALALIKMDMLIEVEPIIYWLVRYNEEDARKTGMNAIMTEPIAEMALRIRSNDTNLRVTIKNERSFSKQLTIKEFNSYIQQYVPLPNYSERVGYDIAGTGYCSITMTTERIVTVPNLISKFKITTEVTNYSFVRFAFITFFVPNYKNLKLCARYETEGKEKTALVNVIYEIEMPSGYTFVEVQDAIKMTEIKRVDSKKAGTLVHVYFSDYEADKDYCINLVAKREFIVNEAAAAGIKIYDYFNKDSAAIEFYKFDSPDC